MRQPTLITAAILIWSTCACAALAQQCKDFGDLRYIGRNAAETRTFWLSTTETGGYRLEAAEGNTTVDIWDRTRPGANLSVSPFVSNGSGGVHRLFARGAAPNGSDCLVDTQNQKNGIIFPAFPPALPGRPTPPIGTLPPAGLMPGLPGRPVPPIGTLPPSGVMPGLPARPSPPIGTLPPTGVMPGVPGRPTSPIGTLPPTGVMPGVPGRPTPPIGTLPPTAVTPAVPAFEGYAYATAPAAAPCNVTDAKYGYVPCDPVVIAPGGVPLTPGRDLGGASPWNAWVDFTQTRIDDDRGPLDTEATDNYVAAGIDYLFRPGLVFGIQLETDRTETEDASGLIEGSTRSAAIGTYFAAETSPNWVVNGLLSFGRSETNLRIATLEGAYTRNRIRASLTANGEYTYRNLLIRPSTTIDYVHFSGADYTLTGPVFGVPETIIAEVPSESYATFTPELELGQAFISGDDVVMPYVRFGITYDLDAADASLPGASSFDDRLSGQTRIGTRMRLGGAFFADASVGYLSAFQDDLDVFEGRLYLSMSF